MLYKFQAVIQVIGKQIEIAILRKRLLFVRVTYHIEQVML